jgi:hypothetical protein
MDSDRLKESICENAAEIVRLHSRIHETLKLEITVLVTRNRDRRGLF